MRVLLFFLFCFLFLQQNPTLSHSLFSSLVSFEELFFFSSPFLVCQTGSVKLGENGV